ncbi:MAG: hypothetical protein LBK52_04925 [Deltaproteobacteria bacterium]|nr:hypothetical protein [Deltaproteobacteria bacterium]
MDFPPDTEFLDLWQEKMFLGQEFLTWLWLSSEIDNYFPGPGGSEVEVMFEKKLSLQSGQGAGRSQVVCHNPDQEWTEAFAALGVRKKLTKAQIQLKTPVFQCSFTLPADTLSPQAVKMTSASETEANEEESFALIDHFLGQVSLVSSLKTVLDALFQNFLQKRLSDQWTSKELPRLRKFLEPKLVKAAS